LHFNCWANDTTEPFLCDKFSHILVAALPLLQTMWPVMVLFNHFRKTNNLFLEASSTFYRLSMLTGNGLIVIIGGYLEQQYGQTKNMVVYHDYRRVIDGYHSIIILQHLELRQVFLRTQM
jgi:hypothetical protein